MLEDKDRHHWNSSDARQADILRRQNRLKDAAEICSKLIRQEPQNVGAWAVLGAVAIDRGDYLNARRFLERASALDPKVPIVQYNLGVVFSFLGMRDEARCHYSEAINLKPNLVEAYYNIASLIGKNEYNALLKRINGLINSCKFKEHDESTLHFAAATICDNMQNFDEAFKHYKKANELKKILFDNKEMQNLVEDSISLFSNSFFQQRQDFGSYADTPIFIVGMPRSGTTLLEQILDCHPNIHGSGERAEINLLASALQQRAPQKIRYPCCLEELKSETIEQIANEYIQSVNREAPSAQRIIDKHPLNFRHLGLISLMFPKARVIHCRRHPLDTCISCYFQNFNKGQEYSFDLNSLGLFFKLYHKLMEHWKSVCPIEILEVSYEDIVADPEKISRELVGFCGMDWDAACANFHMSDRAVITASLWQVRQPVYSHSVGRWRNYTKHLGPLIESLGSLAKDFT